MRAIAATYALPGVGEVVWLQEEPRNMAAWSYIATQLAHSLPPGGRFSTSDGRAREHGGGSADRHAHHQQMLASKPS